jgi:hypothetical protein
MDQREIRFKRAHFFDEGKTDFSHFTEWGLNIGNSSFSSPSWNSRALYHLDIQFTGLLDKVGNLIFEGDIRKFKTGIGIIIWSDAAFAVKSPGSDAIDWEHSSVLIESEYLGNIFETPELLNP